MKRTIATFVCLLLLFSIANGQTREDKKLAKKERVKNQYESAKELINNGQFTFRSNWMNTQGGKRILMDAGSGYLSINDNNANAYFPYFGIVRVATMYEGGGIEFDNEVEDYEVNFNNDRKIISIEFKISGKRDKEKYKVFIQLHNGLAGSVTVFSNKRDQISYDGIIRILEQ